MSRIGIILHSLAAMLLSCCSTDSEVTAQTVGNTGNTLVAYYSYTGNCRDIVSSLTAQTEADVMEIQPAAIMQTYLFNYGPQMAGKHVAMIVSSHSSGISGVVTDARRLLPDATWMGDALWINNSNRANTSALVHDWLSTLNFAEKQTAMEKMYITIDGRTLPVRLVDNSATQTLVAALQEGDITYEAHDYGGFEKVGALGRSLPTSDTQTTTQAGDVILYSGNQIVLFYGSNSWSYTRLGRIEFSSQAELEAFLKAGQGNVSVRLSMSNPTGISKVSAGKSPSKAYTLKGTLAQTRQKGVVIQDGKKIIK